jgi:hypothetical protein
VALSETLDSHQRTLATRDREDRHQQHPPLGKADPAANPAIGQRLEKADQIACGSRGGCELSGQESEAVPALSTVGAAPTPELLGQTSNRPLVQWMAPAVSLATETTQVIYNSYILGPGDNLLIELIDIPEPSGTFSIGPDGTIYLPRLRAIYVEELTDEELRYLLTEQFRTYVKSPQVFINPIGSRAVRVYAGGEISRPDYSMLSGGQVIEDQ